MLKFGKYTLAVAMVLCSASAMANNFRGADQVYVPAAGFLQGSSGIFISDIFIANLEDEAVTVSVIFQGGAGGGQGEEFKNIINLAPRERREFINFLNVTLGKASPTFGQLIFNACRTGQDCGPLTQTNGISPNFREISVESRIYSIPVGTTLAQNPPTVGQAFAGLPWYSSGTRDAQGVGLNTVFVTGFRQGSGPGTYRSNVGLVNASQFSSTVLTVRLFRGAETNALGTTTRTLGPLGHEQLNLTQLFDAAVATGTNLWISVEQTSVTATTPSDALCGDGCPSFFAYGSLLDNATSDAITLEPQFTAQLTDKALGCIYDPTATCKSSSKVRRAVRH